MDDQAPHMSLEDRRRLVYGFLSYVPHNNALGIVLDTVDDGRATMRLPFGEHLVGDPIRGILHGGVITTLIDSACGASVFMAMPQPVPVATLDLRIDYLQAARSGRTVIAAAHCYKVTSNVAFVRCEAYHEDAPGNVIAHGTGTFMMATTRGEHRDAVKVSL